MVPCVCACTALRRILAVVDTDVGRLTEAGIRNVA